MSQLDLLNFFPFLFWFFFIFLFFYFILFCFILPIIFSALSVRRLLYDDLLFGFFDYILFFVIAIIDYLFVIKYNNYLGCFFYLLRVNLLLQRDKYSFKNRIMFQ